MLLALFAGPVYVAAGITALLRRPLAYAVTAKGSLKTRDSVRTFRLHLVWAAIATVLLIVSVRFHHSYPTLQLWGMLAVITGLGPPLIVMANRLSLAPPAVARTPSATVPYDSAWVPFDASIPRQAVPASPDQQARFPGGPRLTDRDRDPERLAYEAPGHRRSTPPLQSWNAR